MVRIAHRLTAGSLHPGLRAGEWGVQGTDVLVFGAGSGRFCYVEFTVDLGTPGHGCWAQYICISGTDKE